MIETIRAKLREKYNQFIEKYGFLNSAKNKRIILQDSLGFQICASLETKVSEKTWIPSDILVRSRKSTIETISTDNCAEALSWVLGTWGIVDINKIAEITSKDENEVITELSELICWNPIDNCWNTQDKWASGNVYTKMKETEKILEELKKDTEKVEPEEKYTVPMGKYTQPRP